MKKILLLTLILFCSSFVFAIGPLDFPADLISYWDAEGDAQDNVSTNHGNLIGGTTFTTGVDGQAFSLDGIDDYVLINEHSSIKWTSSEAFTKALWLKRVSDDDSLTQTALQQERSHISVSRDVQCSNAFEVFSNIADTPLCSGFVTSKDVWHHVVLVYDNTNLTIYVDGQPQVSAIRVLESQNAKNHAFGSVFGAGGFFNGSIDDVAYWDRAFSASDVLDLYNSYPSEQGEIPEVNNNALKIFGILIVALLVGALFLRKN